MVQIWRQWCHVDVGIKRQGTNQRAPYISGVRTSHVDPANSSYLFNRLWLHVKFRHLVSSHYLNEIFTPDKYEGHWIKLNAMHFKTFSLNVKQKNRCRRIDTSTWAITVKYCVKGDISMCYTKNLGKLCFLEVQYCEEATVHVRTNIDWTIWV